MLKALRFFPFGLSNEERKEQQLIVAAQRGDRRAFDTLAHAYSPNLRGFLIRRVGNKASEDILQETLLAAWQGLPRYSARARFKAWVYAIAVNKCTDYFRCLERGLNEVSLDWAVELSDGEHDAYAAIECRILVRDALALLSAEQREVLELYYDGGFSLLEISGALDRNLNTVKYQFYRAHTLVERSVVSEPEMTAQKQLRKAVPSR